MARYTKKDADGRYYIESVNGKLESDKFGRTYGESIDRFAELENADVAPKSEVEEIVRQWKEEANCWQNNYITELRDNEQIKADVARKIFEEIERTCIDTFGTFYIGATHGAFAKLKKKYTEENE